MKNQQDITGHLKYLLRNCQTAFSELKRLNEEFQKATWPNAPINIDVSRIETLHRIVQDYLIIRVVGLFDEKDYAASFEKEFSKEVIYEDIKQEEVIKYLKKLRGNFVAHKHIKSEFPITCKILNSNLEDILKKLDAILTSKMDGR